MAQQRLYKDKVQIAVVGERELMTAVKKAARAERRSVSAFAALVLEAELQRRGFLKPTRPLSELAT